uniref:RNA-dependent RNA polymerase n=1 Tax=Plasmopara viticola lesion associated mitovirus 27 TaxID=2719453 RepID=A0A6G9RV69_9VIRU|nr:RNA-dependent RNA polymerase [Plasmopara viticola lesion associated mitovirus 27]
MTDIFIRMKVISGGSTSLTFITSTKYLSIKLRRILQKQGIKGLCLHLKSSSVALQQSVSGYIIKDLSLVGPRVSRSRGGLPRLIPASHRIIIHNKKPGYKILIRFYLTIFYLYRVLEFKGLVKIETITKPGVEFDMEFFNKYITKFNLLMKFKVRKVDPIEFLKSKARFFAIFKSSPFSSVIVTDPIPCNQKNFRNGKWSTHIVPLLDAMRAVSVSPLFHQIKELSSLYFPKLLELFNVMMFPKHLDKMWEAMGFQGFNPWKRCSLGKLSLKNEAAGKVRVFAMVDPITQWLLSPLHKYLFLILRTIPMDGTFNQLRPVYALLRKKGIRSFFSLDLSAATDRLPLSIQVSLLNDLIPKEGSDFGKLWGELLVDRDYRLTSDEHNLNTHLRYSVGQPMGALSSWGMLAYSHHFIVQVAAWECGFPTHRLFTDYAVLGDDLVISHWRVARQYLSILKMIGVECGLHKSILSHSGLGIEFAKNTFVDGTNVSPISFKELQIAHQDLSAWSAFVSKFGLSWDRQARVLGFGYLSRRKSFKKMNHALQLVHLSQIIKADFNTDTLSLRRGAPKDFDSIYLYLFTNKVLKPLLHLIKTRPATYSQFQRDTQNYIISKVNSKFGTDYYDLRALWDVIWFSEKEEFGIRRPSLRDDMWFSNTDKVGGELLKVRDELIQFCDRVEKKKLGFYKPMPAGFSWNFMGTTSPTFNEALSLYLKGQQVLTKSSLDPHRILVNKTSKRLEGKLPFQVRLFRVWSRLTHTVIKDFRRNISTP